MRASRPLVVGLACSLVLGALVVRVARETTPAGEPIAFNSAALAHDSSRPLRELVASEPEGEGPESGAGLAAPERKGEGLEELAAEEARERVMVRPASAPAANRDPLASTGAPAPAALAVAPSAGAGWDGVGQGMSGFSVQYAPPDTSMDVSATQIVEAVNVSFAIWDKSGARLYGPARVNALWSGFGGLCETTNDGDPTVVFDRLAERWIISQFAISGANGSTVPYLQCVAVSKTADATGAYWRYAFPYSFFPDYPKLAVWPDAYYTTFNGFTQSGGSWFWYGGVVCAYDRVAMLAGSAATQQCWRNSSYGSILVAGVEGPTPPPAGSAAYGLALASSTTLANWRYTLDWANPANSRQSGPTGISVASYSQACSGGTCIPQPGTTNTLDSLGDRLMYRYVYRNNAGTESLLVSHAVSNGGVAAVRWYELRPPASGSTPAVYQAGTYAPDSTYRWMPSISMDGSGDIALIYSASSSTSYPSIRAAGRAPSDALGTLGAETTLQGGAGSQTGSLHRWGDYAIVAVDPAEECTFWAATEYLAASGSFNWRTRIASFALPGCSGSAGFAVTLAQAAAQADPTNAAPIRFALTGTAALDAASVGASDFALTGGTLGGIDCSAGSNCLLAVTPSGQGTVSIAPSGSFEVASTTGDLATSAGGSDRSVSYDSIAPSVSLAQASEQADPAISAPIVFTLSASEPLAAASVTASDFTVTGGSVGSVACASASCAVNVNPAAAGSVTIAPSGTFGVSDPAGNGTTSAGGTDRSVLYSPPPLLSNGGFETGTLSPWTVGSGTALIQSATRYAGAWAAQVGATSRYLGDAALTQTFTLPSNATSLRVYFMMMCNDKVSSDWATITLTDTVSGSVYTPLGRVCNKGKNGVWQVLTYTLPSALRGRAATLALVSHDDGTAIDPSWTFFDSVSVQ